MRSGWIIWSDTRHVAAIAAELRDRVALDTQLSAAGTSVLAELVAPGIECAPLEPTPQGALER